MNNSFGRMRFPKVWSNNMDVKRSMLTAIAHFHCPNQLAPESYVGERQARLNLAKEYASSALDKCVSKDAFLPHELRNSVTNSLEKISRSLDELEQANYEDFHQTVLSASQLRPLKRPTQTMVNSVNIVMGLSCGSVIDGVYENWIGDIFDGVVGIMGMQSGHQSGIPHPSRLPDKNNIQVSFSRRMSQPVGSDSRFGSAQSLVSSMRPRDAMKQPSRRQSSFGVQVGKETLDEVKKFVLDVNGTGSECLANVDSMLESLAPYAAISLSELE